MSLISVRGDPRQLINFNLRMLNMTCDAGQVCVQAAFQGGCHLSCHVPPPQPSGVKQLLTSGSHHGFVHPSFLLGL